MSHAEKIAHAMDSFMRLAAAHNLPVEHAENLWGLAFTAGAMQGNAEMRDLALKEIFRDAGLKERAQ